MHLDKFSAAVLSKMNYQDVQNLASTGEGKYLEFKRTVPSAEKIAREMVAFANTNGGTILIGVDDDKSLIGVDGYQEEEYLLNKAAVEVCIPMVEISIEIVHFGERDLLVIKVPEADSKPVSVRESRGDTVYVRDKDQNRVASTELVEVMKKRNSPKGVSFEYGPNEQKLFRYLKEYGEITVDKYSELINVNTGEASDILVNLVSAGILNLFTKDNIDYFTFSKYCES